MSNECVLMPVNQEIGELGMGKTEGSRKHAACADKKKVGKAYRSAKQAPVVKGDIGEGESVKVRERKSDRRVARTKKAIREAFSRLASNGDYGKVTITAIAREADIDRKTFYLHYDSVEAVTDEIVREEAERIVSLLREESFRAGAANGASGTNGVDVGDLFSRFSVVLVQDLVANGETMAHVAPELLLQKVEQSLTNAIVEDDVFGLASAMGPYLGYCVSFFCAGLVAVYRDWLKKDSEIPLENLAAVTTTAILSGVDGLVRSGRSANEAAALR